MVCQYYQMCARLKVVIDGSVHIDQAIWDEKLTTEDWRFLIVDTKMRSTISIELECCGHSVIYGCPELAFSLTSIVTVNCSFFVMRMGRPVSCTLERACGKGTL